MVQSIKRSTVTDLGSWNNGNLCTFLIFFFSFDEENDFSTPMIVKALATPSGTRRRMKPLDTSFESSKQHCRTCTCNRTILSRREMLTRINFDSSSYSLRPRKVLETPRNSEVSEWQNNNPQEDYVKMSAKLV